MAIIATSIRDLRNTVNAASSDIFFTNDDNFQALWYNNGTGSISEDNNTSILIGNSPPYLKFVRIIDDSLALL